MHAKCDHSENAGCSEEILGNPNGLQARLERQDLSPNQVPG
jgi:hypothetical protein